MIAHLEKESYVNGEPSPTWAGALPETRVQVLAHCGVSVWIDDALKRWTDATGMHPHPHDVALREHPSLATCAACRKIALRGAL